MQRNLIAALVSYIGALAMAFSISSCGDKPAPDTEPTKDQKKSQKRSARENSRKARRRPGNAMKKIYISASVGALGIFSTNAFAQLSNAGVLDTVIERYQGAASRWAEIMTGYASYLFWGLALLSMVITFGYMALKQADPMEFFAELFKFSLTTGFFWWLLTNGPAFATSIISSLRQAGGNAAQVPGLGPSGIVDIGFDIFFTVLDKTEIMSPIDSLIGAVLGLAVLVCLTLIATNMLLLLISGWMLAYGGVFFLGFGGARWTSDMAIQYYKTALGLGAAVMGMTLITGVGQALITEFS